MRSVATKDGERVEEIRRRILDGLEQVLERVPFGDVAVADVVAAAGTSKRAFYEVYPHKGACLVDHLDRFHAAWADGIEQQVLAAPDRLAATQGAVESFLRFFHDRPFLARAHMIDVYTLGPEAVATRDRCQQRYARVVQMLALRDDGTLHLDLDDATARAVVGTIDEVGRRLTFVTLDDDALRAVIDSTVQTVRAIFIGLWVEREMGPVDLTALPDLGLS